MKLETITDLINHLTKIRNEHGSLEVLIEIHGDTDFRPVRSVELMVADEAVEEKLGMKEGTPYFLILP